MPMRTLHSVLCADDDADICEVVKTTLTLIAGLDVRIAASGEQLIDLAYEHRPDLVIMDIMMPGMDGPATFKRMRGSPLIGDIPVIFLTATLMPSELAQFLRLGAIGVIGKPFDPLTLGTEVFTLWGRMHSAPAVPSIPAASAQVHAHVDALSERFLDRARADIVRLRQMMQHAQRGEPGALKQIARISHSIHGTGAMLGFLELSSLGRAVEYLVEKVAACADATDPKSGSTLMRELEIATERLAQAIEAIDRAHSSGGRLPQQRAVS